MRARQLTGAAAVRGRQVLVYPSPLPAWIMKPSKAPKELRQSFDVTPCAIGCNNVLIDAGHFRDGLRFDQRFCGMTGEDTELMTRIAKRRGRLVATDLAVISEEVVAERCTFRRQIARQFSYGLGNTMIDRDYGRHALVALGALWRFLQAGWAATLAVALGGSPDAELRRTCSALVRKPDTRRAKSFRSLAGAMNLIASSTVAE